MCLDSVQRPLTVHPAEGSTPPLLLYRTRYKLIAFEALLVQIALTPLNAGRSVHIRHAACNPNPDALNTKSPG